jgi:hypothetical protein
VSAGWTSLGGDNKEAIEYGTLARDPSKHKIYGISMKWRTTADEAQRRLEPSDFEDWKREKLKHLGQLADLWSMRWGINWFPPKPKSVSPAMPTNLQLQQLSTHSSDLNQPVLST